MAERRFISKQIFNDDIFTDLEVQARLLYVYLVLNADDDLMFVDDTFESAKKTFKSGINDYIEKYSESRIVYDTISAKELIAQLALCISEASVPVYMENGALITGVYRQDGCLRIDTDNKRAQYIQKSLED